MQTIFWCCPPFLRMLILSSVKSVHSPTPLFSLGYFPCTMIFEIIECILFGSYFILSLSVCDLIAQSGYLCLVRTKRCVEATVHYQSPHKKSWRTWIYCHRISLWLSFMWFQSQHTVDFPSNISCLSCRVIEQMGYLSEDHLFLMIFIEYFSARPFSFIVACFKCFVRHLCISGLFFRPSQRRESRAWNFRPSHHYSNESNSRS